MGPRSQSHCSTHKETDRHITAAARTAGFLTEPGIAIDTGELIGAESLSKRLCFLAQLAARLRLKTAVHDDVCHLRLVTEANAEDPPVAKLVSTLAHVEDIRLAMSATHADIACPSWMLSGRCARKPRLTSARS